MTNIVYLWKLRHRKGTLLWTLNDIFCGSFKEYAAFQYRRRHRQRRRGDMSSLRSSTPDPDDPSDSISGTAVDIMDSEPGVSQSCAQWRTWVPYLSLVCSSSRFCFAQLYPSSNFLQCSSYQYNSQVFYYMINKSKSMKFKCLDLVILCHVLH